MTYFFFGLLMSNVFSYDELLQQDVIRDFMRSPGSPEAYIGPFLQPLRALLFAVALWPIRRVLLEKKHGGLVLWGIFVAFGILSTPAAAPCSIEGVIYSKLPLYYHIVGLPEIGLQTLVFSLILVAWEKRVLRKASGEQESHSNPLLAEVIKAAVTGCFAYAGYAVGGILLALFIGAEIDEGAGVDLRIQMMFVVAFLVNAVSIFFVARQWRADGIALWQVFALYWVIDTAVPMLYQLVVFGETSFAALVLGFFPAVVIAVSMRLNYKRSAA
jgi:hypothetical protein